MDLSGAYAFFHDLEGRIKDLGLRTSYVEGIRSPQIGDTLRVLMPLSAEEGHPVLTEFMITELAADYNLLLIYSTFIAPIGERRDELTQKLIDWNLICPMGHFGIYEEEDQLYHKYTLPFPVDTSPETLADLADGLLGLIFELLSGRYDELAEFLDESELDEEEPADES